MKLELVGTPFTYTWPGGRIRFEPGKPVDLDPERAAKVMKKVPGRVRVVEHDQTITIASEPPRSRGIYFFRQSTGTIVGPATADFATKVGNQFWLCVSLGGSWSFIDSSWLRSRKEFDAQPKVRTFELIREPKVTR